MLAGGDELIGQAEAEYVRVEAALTALGRRPSLVNPAQASILVVDDDPLNRKLLVRLLEQEGHRVETAANGREALERVPAEPPDVVLLDIVMPELDGISVLERLKADPALQHVPVIMISAVDELESVVRCVEIGAEDYLPKPFDAVLLRARINAGLAKKRLYELEREPRPRRLLAFRSRARGRRRAGPDGRRPASRRRAVTSGRSCSPTSAASRHSPRGAPADRVLEILNQYFDEMIEAIFAWGGTLVGYRGDGLLVVFGAPIPFDDHADRALAACSRDARRSPVEIQHAGSSTRASATDFAWESA